MQALILEPTTGEGGARRLQRTAFRDGLGHDEKWLQRLLFENPSAVPIDEIDPSSGTMIPLCREFPIAKPGGTVFLDMLGVTPQGRLVLVECKLWRNPQARREVIAQILEYASHLRRSTYADLTARLKATLHWTGANPIFDHARRWVSDLNEARFVDAVGRSLTRGDFELIVAGDGIRPDVYAIADHLNGYGIAARLALVEFQLWSDDAGRTIVIPSIPLRTEVVQQRVLVDQNNQPLQLEAPPELISPAEAPSGSQAEDRDANNAFWQRFIEEVRFDHPEQSPPKHGGNNWVRMPLPAPAGWMTAFRAAKRIGIFIRLKGEDGKLAYDTLEQDRDALTLESGLTFEFEQERQQPFQGTIGVYRAAGTGTSTDSQQLLWLKQITNRAISSLRLRLSKIE